MTAAWAAAGLAARATARSPVSWAVLALAAGLTWLAPDLATFAFSAESHMAQAGTLGTALLAPMVIAGSAALGFRPRAGQHAGLGPLLVGPARTVTVTVGLIAGFSGSAVGFLAICIVCGTFSLSTRSLGLPDGMLPATVIAAAWSTALAGSALALATLLPAALAWTLALGAALLVGTAPVLLPPEVFLGLPSADVAFPARDAAFGDLRWGPAMLSAGGALLVAAGAAALTVAGLRAKELAAPPPVT